MAPQGFIKHASAFEADLFSLPVKSAKERKRKSQELNPNAPVFKRRKEKQSDFVQEPPTITIDSDVEVEEVKSHEVVTVSDSSDNESVKIYEPEKESESDKNDVHNNLIININQTENVDNIVDSALGRLANRASKSVLQNEAKKDCVVEPVHWSQASGFPKSWTKEMIRFYAEPSEKNRNFDYKEILNRMKTKPSDWLINRDDMVGTPSRRKRSFEVCRRCDKFGHMTSECPRKNIVCYICGGFNHRYPNCPNTLCLTCGKPASRNLYRCDSCDRALRKKEPCGLCQQSSHEEFMCPSKWRKHLLLDPSSQALRLNPNPFCYNCAQKGHFGFECQLTPDSSYPLENPLATTFNMNSVIVVPKETAVLLHSEAGNTFLKRLSTQTQCRIDFFEGGQNNYIRIVGDENQVRVFENELEKLKNETR